MNRCRSPSGVSSRPPRLGWPPTSVWTTSPTVPPPTSRDFTPPTSVRRIWGMKTRLIGRCRPASGPPARTRREDRCLAALARRAGFVATDRAVHVPLELELGERAVEGIEEQQTAGERLADPEDDLQDLIGLEQAHDPGHHAEHAGHGAAGCERRRRRRRIEAAVARPD